MTEIDPLSQLLASKDIIILDGAMGTELQNRGHDVSNQLWSASILIDHPQSIYDVHLQYFEHGADITITASYQAAIQGLLENGDMQDETKAQEIIRTSSQLALKARDDYWQTAIEGRPRGLVAGSVGPYGAYLGTGAEYTGDYDYTLTTEDLKQFHRGRLLALLDTDIDAIAFETIPSYKELEAIVELFNEVCAERARDSNKKRKVSAWVSLSVKDAQYLGDGSSIEAACKLINQHTENFKSIGVNCNPLLITKDVLATLHKFTNLPLVVYPNSGESYDATTKKWSRAGDCQTLEGESPGWIKNGARIIGGCCRTAPKDINKLYKAHGQYC
ncbi:homocysteine S-methyltransferase [Nadsonia fulvescens var. elongata DSM 6958]|uniref:Homocysteine S-methyltransferase n=1 Tax=Nadsonia fulvescens var. elongata DSM 6958 TaxID=857566 RepID=A0A1E3PMX2_9ASCO|nr:homocysteine S-methyltransferase [Nadsonia fulvescens var. elongata DSM 6958]